jgi:uncharacterized protein
MRLTEVQFDDSRPIDGYGPGFFRIGGKVHHSAVLAMGSGVHAWGEFEDIATVLAAKDDLDVLFVGTGPEITHIPAPFREALEEAGIGVEPMSSPAACRTYNVLLSEGRRVAAALIPV